jgi:hypothetical protein
MNSMVYGTVGASAHFLEFTLENWGNHSFSTSPKIKSFPPLTQSCVWNAMNLYFCLHQKLSRRISLLVRTNPVDKAVLYEFRSKYFVKFSQNISSAYTGCNRRNRPNFGRLFLRSNYTEITQKTYIQSWTVTEILAREKSGLLCCLRTVLSVTSYSPPTWTEFLWYR